MNKKSITAALCALGLAAFTSFVSAEEATAAATNGLSYDDKLKACGACHGEHGDKPLAPDYPTLAGQHADYIVQALQHYRDGRRNHPIMAMQVKALGLTDADMLKLGQYFSAQAGLQTLNVK
jgi:cytochrome c553